MFKRFKNVVWVVFLLFVILVGVIWFIQNYKYTYYYTDLPKYTLSMVSNGKNADPINIIIVGNSNQISEGFRKAGWLVPDPITTKTSVRIAYDAVRHKSYPTAPVSNEYLFGRVQDLAFEKATNDVQKRNHIRLWETKDTLNGREIWIGAAIYDNGIELQKNLFPTHHVMPEVDQDRASVVSDLSSTNLLKVKKDLQFNSPAFERFNAAGDYYDTDGIAAFISFNDVSQNDKQNNYVIYSLKNTFFANYNKLLEI